MYIFKDFFKKLEAPHRTMYVSEASKIGNHIQKVVLKNSNKESVNYPIGSYIQPMIGGCVPRAYSVVEDNGDGCTIMVSFSGKGVGARFFKKIQCGDIVNVYGPFDDFKYRYNTGRPKIFIATGTGVSPFVRMVHEAIKEDLPVLLVLGVPEESDIPYREYFEFLGREHKVFDFLATLSNPGSGWNGAVGYVTSQFNSEDYGFLRLSDIYICGVPPMITGIVDVLRNANVPAGSIFIQKFG